MEGPTRGDANSKWHQIQLSPHTPTGKRDRGGPMTHVMGSAVESGHSQAGQFARSLRQLSSRGSGITLDPATAVMKLVSPNHRGSTCMCR